MERLLSRYFYQRWWKCPFLCDCQHQFVGCEGPDNAWRPAGLGVHLWMQSGLRVIFSNTYRGTFSSLGHLPNQPLTKCIARENFPSPCFIMLFKTSQVPSNQRSRSYLKVWIISVFQSNSLKSPTATPPPADRWAIGGLPSVDWCNVTLLDVGPLSVVSSFAITYLCMCSSR